MTDNLNFWSAKNYMKRDASTGSTNLSPPTTLSLGNYVTKLTVPHNLGIVPFFKLYYEAAKDGIIWESMSTRSQGAASNPSNPSSDVPYLIGYADTTNLTIELGFYSNTLTGTYPVYYVIYKDYGLA